VAPRVLILTPYADVRAFQHRVFSRALLWGLEHRMLDWELHQPWKPRNDLRRFDAVMTWNHGWADKRGCIAYCREFQERCARLGLPVINPLEDIRREHSHYLDRWSRHGLPCARHQRFQMIEEIDIPYPLILRRDGRHGGRSMFLVKTPDEARALMDRQSAHAESGGDHPAPPNLAVEFIDTRDAGGENHKFRSYVIGDRVLPVHQFRARAPFVGYQHIILDPISCSVDRAFLSRPIDEDELLLRAARALSTEIVSLDYARRPDGRLILWEPNFGPLTAGDQPMSWLSIRAADLEIGRAIADLIRSRL
jgi:hypothetical protein